MLGGYEDGIERAGKLYAGVLGSITALGGTRPSPTGRYPLKGSTWR